MIPEKETKQSVEDFLKSGGKITKITKDDIHNSPVKRIGYFRPIKTAWKGKTQKKFF